MIVESDSDADAFTAFDDMDKRENTVNVQWSFAAEIAKWKKMMVDHRGLWSFSYVSTLHFGFFFTSINDQY